MAQVIVLLPELWLMGGSILVLMAGLWLDRRVQPLLVALVLALSFYFVRPVSGLFFDGMLVFDDLAYAIRKILLAGTGALLLFGKSKHHRPEFYFLMIAVLTGSFFMLSVVNFLLVYLAIELTSYGSYFLSGFRFTLKSSESSLKYLLFGGISSAVMLYGISLLYGAGGGLVMTGLEDTPLVRTGLVLFMAGMLFKTSVAPLHLWVPSTYQEAPTDAVAFFAFVPKLAAFTLMYHVYTSVSGPLAAFVLQVLMVVAILTVLWGTLAAIPQTKVKRLLAYGAIAHSGFLLPLALQAVDTFPFVYYGAVYTVMNLGVFYFVHVNEGDVPGTLLMEKLNGRGRLAPWIGVGIVVILVSLVGLPPTGGFNAKLYLFSLVWTKFLQTSELLWLLYFISGIFASAVALFYYFKIVRSYFLKEGSEGTFHASNKEILIQTIFALLLLWFFIQPDILNRFAF